MERWGYTNAGAKIALIGLERKKYIGQSIDVDRDGDQYSSIHITKDGQDWIYNNMSRFTLKAPANAQVPPGLGMPRKLKKLDDDIPF